MTAAVLLAAALGAGEGGSQPDPPATAIWDELLRQHARGGGLDYASLARDRGRLESYLEAVAATDVGALDDAAALAFWINAYNAGVARLVLERYPGLASVEDVDGFFDELTVEVAGRAMTLDEIETRARDSGDARVHFAVVCASASCPDLRAEAYVGARLEEQLSDQTSRFLADRDKGLRFDPEREELHLSSIFKWYAGDFTGGSTVVAFFARSQITAWVLPHLPEELAERIRAAAPAVRYMDYDWTLNDR